MEDRKDSKLSKDELRRFRRAQDDIAELNHAIRGEHKNRSGKYEKTKEPAPEQIEQFRRKRIEIAGKALSGKKPALAK